MEGESVDYYFSKYTDHGSILAYAQGGAQAGSYCRSWANELFDTTLQNLSIGSEQSDDSPVRLAPASLNYTKLPEQVANNQSSLLRSEGVLRPRNMMAQEKQNSCMTSYISSGPKSTVGSNRKANFGDDQLYANDMHNGQVHAYADADGCYSPVFGAQNETGCQAWIAAQPNAYRDEAFGHADNILAIDLNESWSSSDYEDAVMLGENEAATVDCHHEIVTLNKGDSMPVDNLTKGAILPNLTVDEANAGQQHACFDASSGFGCDGNRITYSLTKDSSE